MPLVDAPDSIIDKISTLMSDIETIFDRLLVISTKEKGIEFEENITKIKNQYQTAVDNNNQFDMLKFKSKWQRLMEKANQMTNLELMIDANRNDIIDFLQRIERIDDDLDRIQILKKFFKRKNKQIQHLEMFEQKLRLNDYLDTLFEESAMSDMKKLFEVKNEIPIMETKVESARAESDFDEFTSADTKLKSLYKKQVRLSERIQRKKEYEQIVRETIDQDFMANPQLAFEEVQQLLADHKKKQQFVEIEDEFRDNLLEMNDYLSNADQQVSQIQNEIERLSDMKRKKKGVDKERYEQAIEERNDQLKKIFTMRSKFQLEKRILVFEIERYDEIKDYDKKMDFLIRVQQQQKQRAKDLTKYLEELFTRQ